MPNVFGSTILQINPKNGQMLFIGSKGCDQATGEECYAEAYYSNDMGAQWNSLAKYVRNCVWGNNDKFKGRTDTLIICEQYENARGDQRNFVDNPLSFVASEDYFKNKRVLFKEVVGFGLVKQFLAVAEVIPL